MKPAVVLQASGRNHHLGTRCCIRRITGAEAHQTGEEAAYTQDPCKEAQITAALGHELSTILQMPPW